MRSSYCDGWVPSEHVSAGNKGRGLVLSHFWCCQAVSVLRECRMLDLEQLGRTEVSRG